MKLRRLPRQRELAGTGTGLQVPLTVYGRIPPSQTVAAGNYTDTINVTVTF